MPPNHQPQPTSTSTPTPTTQPQNPTEPPTQTPLHAAATFIHLIALGRPEADLVPVVRTLLNFSELGLDETETQPAYDLIAQAKSDDPGVAAAAELVAAVEAGAPEAEVDRAAARVWRIAEAGGEGVGGAAGVLMREMGRGNGSGSARDGDGDVGMGGV
ncbi:hypothetical protein MBLNU230_g5691t1 [Neophaeotheca triangularis]